MFAKAMDQRGVGQLHLGCSKGPQRELRATASVLQGKTELAWSAWREGGSCPCVNVLGGEVRELGSAQTVPSARTTGHKQETPVKHVITGRVVKQGGYAVSVLEDVQGCSPEQLTRGGPAMADGWRVFCHPVKTMFIPNSQRLNSTKLQSLMYNKPICADFCSHWEDLGHWRGWELVKY